MKQIKLCTVNKFLTKQGKTPQTIMSEMGAVYGVHCPGKTTNDCPGKTTNDCPGKTTNDCPGKTTNDKCPGKTTNDKWRRQLHCPGKTTNDKWRSLFQQGQDSIEDHHPGRPIEIMMRYNRKSGKSYIGT